MNNEMRKPNFNNDEKQKQTPSLLPDEDLHFLMNKKYRGSSSSQEEENFEEPSQEYEDNDEQFDLDVGEDDYDNEDLMAEAEAEATDYGNDMEATSSAYSLEEDTNKQDTKSSNNFFGNLGGIFGGGNQEETTDTTISKVSQRPKRSAPSRPKTFEEILEEKQEILYRLQRLSKSGYNPSKKFTMQSDLNDMKFEYERLKKQRDIDKSIKMQRGILMSVVSGAEWLNKNFNPLEFKLDGWSESIHTNLQEYDDVFEELHDKYKEKISMAPELKLVSMIISSAFMFHLSNSLFKSTIPDMDTLLKQDPNLMQNVQQAALNSMRKNAEQQGKDNIMSNAIFNSAQQGINRKMKGPSGVDDILSKLNSRNLDVTDDTTE